MMRLTMKVCLVYKGFREKQWGIDMVDRVCYHVWVSQQVKSSLKGSLMRRAFRALTLGLKKLVSSKRQSLRDVSREYPRKRANVMKTLTQPEATAGQIKQITRVGQDAVEKAITDFGLYKDGAQRVHGNAEFAARIREATTIVLKDLLVSDQFKDEEVASNYGYLSGYQVKSIMDQINILRSEMISGESLSSMVFGDAFVDTEVMKARLPEHSEGWFVIPRWEKIAPTYGQAVEVVFDKLREAYGGKFENYRKGQLGSNQFRQTQRTIAMFQSLAVEQDNRSVLIVPAQFGIRHRGRSIRRAREVFASNEFGLGAFAIGIMLLTHPERLQNVDDLWIDCAGDEYSPYAGGRFECAPVFSCGVRVGRLEFEARWFADAYGDCGSVSAFLPQE